MSTDKYLSIFSRQMEAIVYMTPNTTVISDDRDKKCQDKSTVEKLLKYQENSPWVFMSKFS